MDGKVQSGFRLTLGGNPQACQSGVVRWLSAVRNIRLTPLHISPHQMGYCRVSPFSEGYASFLVCQRVWLLACGVGMAAGPPWIRVGS